MRKQDFLGWVFVSVFGTIGGLAGMIFFAVWFVGCANETFTMVEEPLPDSGRERMIVDGGVNVVDDSSTDAASKDVFSGFFSPYDPPCSPDADVGDAAIAVNAPSQSSCFSITEFVSDGGIGGYTSNSCSAPVDCPKMYPFKPLSVVCYGGDGGQLLASGCVASKGDANNWWYCCP